MSKQEICRLLLKAALKKEGCPCYEPQPVRVAMGLTKIYKCSLCNTHILDKPVAISEGS